MAAMAIPMAMGIHTMAMVTTMARRKDLLNLTWDTMAMGTDSLDMDTTGGREY